MLSGRSYYLDEVVTACLPPADPPSVSIEGYDNNWYVGRSDATLLCMANGNPAPTAVTWTA